MTARRPFFAANWKMHKGPTDTSLYVDRFRELVEPRSDRRIAFFPPAISIPAFAEAAADRRDLEFGVQDVHEAAEGAHTGAVSAAMAADAGATLGLAGHSERRREFGDPDRRVGRKALRLAESALEVVLCVGETLEEREAGELAAVLERQLEGAFAELPAEHRPGLIYAYEPVWAIGTGKTATPGDASDAHAILRETISRHTDAGVASDAVILYGGSVKPSNIAELLGSDGVDGVLVGGASLDPESFAEICRA